MERLTRELGGHAIFVKHDNETGAELSGNKVRKLEFLLADALARGTDCVLTCGAVQSNHCRATAVAARRLGMDSVLFLRGEDPGDRTGNLLLDELVGAELHFITPEQYANRAELMGEAARLRRSHGRRPYVIPEGGSNALGSFGYVLLMDELLRQGGLAAPAAGSRADARTDPRAGARTDTPANAPANAPAEALAKAPANAPADGLNDPRGDGPGNAFLPWDHIVCAAGSGWTLAGLHLGAKLLGLDVRIWGVNVCDTGPYFQGRVLSIAREFAVERLGMEATPTTSLPPSNESAGGDPGTIGQLEESDRSVRSTGTGAVVSRGGGEDLADVDLGMVVLRREEIGILEGYKGPGYGKASPELLAFTREVARRDGLLLDPVYTGKAFHGMVKEIERGRFRAGERILFLHTGGVFSLFGPAVGPG